MIQKNNSVSSAKTNDDSSNVANETTSSPTCTKPLVGCSFSLSHYDKVKSYCEIDTTPNYLKERFENNRPIFPVIPW